MGVVKTMKLLKSPGAFQAFSEAVVHYMVERLRIVQVVSQEAKQYQKDTLTYFAPSPQRGVRNLACISSVAKLLLNGDWRDRGSVQHVCRPGNQCCTSRQHTIEKIRHWVPAFLKALQVRLLNQTNWAEWHSALNILGCLGRLHGVFAPAFQQAFGATGCEQSSHPWSLVCSKGRLRYYIQDALELEHRPSDCGTLLILSSFLSSKFSS